MKPRRFPFKKQLICDLSPVFAAAFNGPLIEGQTQTMTLEDVDFPTLRAFEVWFYKKWVPIRARDRHNSEADKDLAKLWIFAQRVLMAELQNDTMNIFYSTLKDHCNHPNCLIKLRDLAMENGSKNLQKLS